ncbi:MAG: hypothetical protein IJZ74_07730 [Clostridia bacterium]|nr:hypothetical protein [Clostridia bacterium]
MKKLLAILLLFIMLVPSAMAEAPMTSTSLKMYVNQIRMVLVDEENNIEPFLIHNDEVYVPLEAFVSSLGGEYVYDAESGTITIQLPIQPVTGTAETPAPTPTPTATPEPAPTENPRIEITTSNIRQYFNISFKLTNISDTTKYIQGMPFNDVTADLVLTCYPVVACDLYNVNFTVEANFNTDWVKEHLGWTTETFRVSLPASGNYTTTKELRSYEIRYSFNLKENNAWFSFIGGNTTSGRITSASGYIILK